MSSSDHTTRSHPVLGALAALDAALEVAGGAPAWSMTETQAGEALLLLSRVESRLAAIGSSVAAHAHRVEVGRAEGATSTAAWWAHRTRMTHAEAHRRVARALVLDERHPEVTDALASGDVRADQAQAVVDAVEVLPPDVGAAVREQARAHLLAESAHLDARALRVLGRRVLDVVAPEVGEAELARQLDAEERVAAQASRLTMHDDGHGRTHGRFTLPTWQADLLRTVLHGLASPRRDRPRTGASEAAGSSGPERLGRAFGEYVERYPRDRVPDAGGLCATAVVTMTLETLTGGLAAAHLDTGTPLSPGLARRLACEAGIIPVVLGGASQVLDVGRRRRLHTPAQRIALATRDHGCTTVGCSRPAAWCEAHHDTPWSQGGSTTVDDARLLCSRHHHLAHHPAYATTHHTGRRVSFTRRE